MTNNNIILVYLCPLEIEIWMCSCFVFCVCTLCNVVDAYLPFNPQSFRTVRMGSSTSIPHYTFHTHARTRTPSPTCLQQQITYINDCLGNGVKCREMKRECLFLSEEWMMCNLYWKIVTKKRDQDDYPQAQHDCIVNSLDTEMRGSGG